MRIAKLVYALLPIAVILSCKTGNSNSAIKDDSFNADNQLPGPDDEAQAAARRGNGKPIKISDFNGTFLQLMMKGGLKDAMDADEKSSISIADAATIHAHEKEFDASVPAKVYRLFKNGSSGFDDFVASIPPGTSTTPETVISLIKTKLTNLANPSEAALDKMIVAPFLAISSGAGVPVIINGGNSYMNYGYLPPGDEGSTAADAVKTGRSFGANSIHALLDVSDVTYLKELSAMLTGGNQDVGDFYKVLLQVLTQCDTSGVSSLSPQGQEVLTDFLGVYTAELRRHLMVNLGASHPWEIDLGATTMVSAFFVKAHSLTSTGKLVPGDLTSFFGKGTVGSGIGETRKDRLTLTGKLSKAEMAANTDVATKMNAVMKTLKISAGGDVIQGLMQALSTENMQDTISSNAKAIVDGYAAFMKDISENSSNLKI